MTAAYLCFPCINLILNLNSLFCKKAHPDTYNPFNPILFRCVRVDLIILCVHTLPCYARCGRRIQILTYLSNKIPFKCQGLKTQEISPARNYRFHFYLIVDFIPFVLCTFVLFTLSTSVYRFLNKPLCI